MNKNLYKFFIAALLFTVVFSSCKKNNDNVTPGISYGIIGIEPAMASTGDTIKVYGIGFNASAAGNTLKLNGVAAKIISASASELDVVVPVAPRSGKVSVETGGKTFTYGPGFIVATVIAGKQTT